MRVSKYHFWVWLYSFIFLSGGWGLAQSDTLQPSDKPLPQKTAVREDVHRFMGFESPLLVRYLSLPYDAIMSTNLKETTIETGFLLLFLLPFALMWSDRAPSVYKWIMGGILLLVLIFSLGSTWIVDHQLAETGAGEVNSKLAQGEGFLHSLRNTIHWGPVKVYTPLRSNGTAPDPLSYPVLCALCLGVLLTLHLRIRDAKKGKQALVVFLFLYGCLWVLLSGGLVHYGLLLFALGPVFAVYAWTKGKSQGTKWRRGTLYGMIGIWLIIAFVIRFENNKPHTLKDAHNLFDQPTALYVTGEYDEATLLDYYRHRFGEAADLINREDTSLVYVAGTRLPFYIEKSDARCVVDNFLVLFNQVQTKYPDKKTQMEVLKASGFRYIVFSLHLGSVDRTPEQSLKKKFDGLATSLFENPNAKLLVTDRKLKLNNSNREEYGIFLNYGTPVSYGRYAVFEIL